MESVSAYCCGFRVVDRHPLAACCCSTTQPCWMLIDISCEVHDALSQRLLRRCGSVSPSDRRRLGYHIPSPAIGHWSVCILREPSSLVSCALSAFASSSGLADSWNGSIRSVTVESSFHPSSHHTNQLCEAASFCRFLLSFPLLLVGDALPTS